MILSGSCHDFHFEKIAASEGENPSKNRAGDPNPSLPPGKGRGSGGLQAPVQPKTGVLRN